MPPIINENVERCFSIKIFKFKKLAFLQMVATNYKIAKEIGVERNIDITIL
jgi:hypothetical protein